MKQQTQTVAFRFLIVKAPLGISEEATLRKTRKETSVSQPASESPWRSLVRLQARPDTTHVTHGRTALVTAHDGFIRSGSHLGLFSYETRLLSNYVWLVNGSPPRRVIDSNVRQHTWMGYYVCPPPNPKGAETDAAQHTIELRLSRYVGEGVHEDVDIENHNQRKVRFRLELQVDGDFADQAEVEQGRRKQHGRVTRRWSSAGGRAWELHFDYRAQHRYDHQGNSGVAHLHRGIVVRVEKASSPPRHRGRAITFTVDLRPHEKWHACVIWTPIMDREPLVSHYGCYAFFDSDAEWDRKRKVYLAESTRVSTPGNLTLSGTVSAVLEQARRDLDSLRLHDSDVDDRSWTIAAGVPTYLALFGRDTLISSWQSGMLGPEIMRGSLRTLVPWQGKETNDWRDEQPGRMLHEAHSGPLSVLNYIPRARYYGAVTPSFYYPIVVAALWHWTGDKQQVLPFIEPALRALAWTDKYGDLDCDGFYEYKTRSEQGLKNQGWKDSSDAIVYEDGSQVTAPIGTCEMQGFVYAAKLHLSAVLWWLDRKQEARRLFTEARELKKRFNDAFWMEDAGYFCMGLDPEKRQIKSIGSDPGHCLTSGIVDTALAPIVAERMMSDDLFSGWGIRTLSSRHPAFDPFSYHRGTILPVENGAFALAFVRFGFHDKVERLCRAIFEAASLFNYYRLPEVFSGHARDSEHPFPALYPRSDWPQAWSASCVFNLLQAILGLFPYAPLDLLIVNPRMPEWLPEITLHGMRVGHSTTTIRFYRKSDGESDWNVLEQRGKLHIVQQPSPWSLTDDFADRVKDVLHSLLPGR